MVQTWSNLNVEAEDSGASGGARPPNTCDEAQRIVDGIRITTEKFKAVLAALSTLGGGAHDATGHGSPKNDDARKEGSMGKKKITCSQKQKTGKANGKVPMKDVLKTVEGDKSSHEHAYAFHKLEDPKP
ncbi:unnamed protein product [Cuscuta campestris]|uniref:Uncharacterized protein n=1 Tax=Cuscuta campestris TaxID=132261 RepID=A0A484KQ95_9ASTE|nr:unnamed protein product [Cuscuta campestris]